MMRRNSLPSNYNLGYADWRDWRNGWLEYWKVGILDLNTLFHFSTIPLF
jgi:hypothetical protein